MRKNAKWLLIGFNILLFIYFMVAVVKIFTRTVDAAGITQTTSLRMLTFAIWFVFYLMAIVFQVILYLLVRLFIKVTFRQRQR